MSYKSLMFWRRQRLFGALLLWFTLSKYDGGYALFG
ncbi:hypothetical protein SEEPB585_05546 [Salmonella enterica subsp. enterica serovar Paratyphi B str. ATCC BAA-1585]|nr:hypothetical protein SEEPB585_05546 [Salmonella enterica subsp. enterica serovar Paratyphi B str. ATCC BAA-1585]